MLQARVLVDDEAWASVLAAPSPTSTPAPTSHKRHAAAESGFAAGAAGAAGKHGEERGERELQVLQMVRMSHGGEANAVSATGVLVVSGGDDALVKLWA